MKNTINHFARVSPQTLAKLSQEERRDVEDALKGIRRPEFSKAAEQAFNEAANYALRHTKKIHPRAEQHESRRLDKIEELEVSSAEPVSHVHRAQTTMRREIADALQEIGGISGR